MNKFTRPCLVFFVIALMSPMLLVAQDRSQTITPQKIGGGSALIGNGGGQTVGRNRVQVRNANGGKTINVREDKRDIEIIQRADGHIFVNITKHYGPDELDSLVRREPELAEHVDSFPTMSGDKDVQLSVSITTRYDAANENELKAKNNAAFNLYKRYIRHSSGQSSLPTGRNRIGIGSRQIGPAIPGRGGTNSKPKAAPDVDDPDNGKGG